MGEDQLLGAGVQGPESQRPTLSAFFPVPWGHVMCDLRKGGRADEEITFAWNLSAPSRRGLATQHLRAHPEEALRPSWEAAGPGKKEQPPRISGSKNSWLGMEICGKLSFPRGLSVTLFNSAAQSWQ